MTTKIPAELSSTPGIADSSNATAITIDSSENITVVGSITIDTGTNGVPTINLSHSNANADNFRIQGGISGVGNSGMSIRDVDASANRLTIDTSGNVSVVGGNLVIGTSGKGIDFSATGTPGGGTVTVNSSLLDDYEEGTWTPTFAGVAAAAVYGARYTKIGQLVMVEAYVAGDTQNNTNQFQIGGLPYTSHNVTAYGGGSIQYTSSQDYSEFGGPLIPANSTYIYFHRIDGSSDASVTNNILYNKINGNQLFIFQAFYRTA